MNSRPRALLLLVLLAAAWGSIVASPFRAFAELCRFGPFTVASALGLATPLAALVAYVFALAVLIALLLASRSRAEHFVPALCALAAFGYNLIASILAGTGFTIAITTSIGLALAVAFILPKSPRPALWLGDAFTMSISAMVLFDAVILPLARKLSVTLPYVKTWFAYPTDSLVLKLDGLWGLDALLWGGIVALVFLVPTVFLTVGRPRG